MNILSSRPLHDILEFWQSMANHHPSEICGRDSSVSGQITAFCLWSNEGLGYSVILKMRLKVVAYIESSPKTLHLESSRYL